MSKLPGINYTARVPSLGRHDIRGPLRVANAQAAAADAIGVGIKEFSDYFEQLQIEDGENKATEALSDLIRQDAKIRTNPNIDERLAQLEEIDATIATTYREGLSRTADKAFEEKYVKISAVVLDNLARDSIIEKNDQVRREVIKSSTELAYMGHREEADFKIDQSNVLSDNEKAEVKKANQLQYELGLVENVSLNGSEEEIKRILDGITAETYAGPLKGPARNAAIRQLQNALVLRGAEEQAAIARFKEVAASDLEIAVNRGLASYTEIEDYFEKEIISGAKRTQLTLKVDEINANEVTDAAAVELVNLSLVNGVPLDGRNKDHRDAVDRWYESIKEEYEGDVQKILEHAVNVAGRTNILPSEVESTIHSVATAGTAEMVGQTANLYEVLERDAPQTLNRLGTEAKAIYKSYLAFVNAGTPPEEAIINARENASKPENEKALLRQVFTSEVAPDVGSHKSEMESWMDKSNGRFDISWGPIGAPEPTYGHYAAYRSLQQEYFTLTGGDIELSKQLARSDFERIFSTTEINGRQEVMAYAPDREFTRLTKGSGDHLLYEDLKRFYAKHKIENGFIMSDGITARDPIGERTYAVFNLQDNGLPEQLPYRWTPDAKWIAEQYRDAAKEAFESSKKFEKHRNDYLMYRMGATAYE